ncbi:MAG: alpha/beta hydrolase [Desulfovibrionaceae bacterium]|nr:alpha/beta hydrolase [Desulfovibrionaceae bacterium]
MNQPISADMMQDIPPMLPLAVRERLARGQRLTTVVEDGRRIIWHAWQPEDAAAPGGAPVALLHGGSGSWTHWVKNIVPLLDAGRCVLTADLPGFGDSDPPATGSGAEAMVEPMAASLRALPAHAAADGPVDLVGFSFGGVLAATLLAAHPGLARRLVLVGAPAMGVVPERQFQLKGWRHLTSPQERAAIHRHNLGVLMLRDHALIDGLALEIHTANVQRDRLPRRRFAPDALARILPRVRCPVHAIYGARDALYGPYIHRLPDAFAAAPGFRGLRLIDGAGHWVQFEAAQAFDAALRAALED